MKYFGLIRYALTLGAVSALLAACGGSQPPGATAAMLQHPVQSISASANGKGIYVSDDSGVENRTVFGFTQRNRKNKPPICTLETGAGGEVAVDNEGNVMLATGDARLFVFKGPDMCGSQVGAIDTNGITLDAASADAATGKIIVGNFQMINPSGSSDIQICSLAAGCSAQLTNPTMNELTGVALSKKGDCWGSGLSLGSTATLTYFKGCSGSGQSATGFKNRFSGGLDIDKDGNLVSIDQDQGFWVYKGCNPKCKVIGGPFPFEGSTTYGHLNEDSTALVAADWQYGQADVYAYSPTKITYKYSFNNGLSSHYGVSGAAYNPRSKE